MKKTYIVKVATTGKVEREEFRADDPLAQMKEAVGGWVEHVPVVLSKWAKPMPGNLDVMVNEEGLLERLPENVVLERFVHARAGTWYTLVGNGVIVAHDEAGETVGMDEVTCAEVEASLSRCGANK